MKIVAVGLLIIINVLIIIYLLLPSPQVPALPDSVKSNEPGDTIQIPGVSAYFSNLQRKEVTTFYRQHFSKSPFLNLPLPTIRLNHPPEYARLAIRDQILSSYLEEYVHPLKDSLMVNGWEPDVYFANNPDRRHAHQIYIGEKKYFSKTTLRIFESNAFSRLLIYFVTLALSYLLYKLAKRIINSGQYLS